MSDQILLEIGSEIVVALLFAAVGGVIALRLGAPVQLGYLGAGVALGPFTPGHGANADVLAATADLAVVMLLFIFALRFPLAPLLGRPFSAVLAAGQVLGVALVGSIAATVLGAEPGTAIVIGTALATSSATLIAAVLAGRVAREATQLAVTISLMQGAIALSVFSLGPRLTIGSEFGLGFVLLASILMAAGFLAGRRALVAALTRPEQQDELPPLLVIAVALIAVVAPAAYVGLPLALAGLISGWLVGSVGAAGAAVSSLVGVRGFFVALFLVGLGSLVDPSALISNIGVVAALLGVVLGLKWLTSMALVGTAANVGRTRALLVSAALTPCGEISFVLGQEGMASGLLEDGGHQLLVGATAVSMAGVVVGRRRDAEDRARRRPLGILLSRRPSRASSA